MLPKTEELGECIFKKHIGIITLKQKDHNIAVILIKYVWSNH